MFSSWSAWAIESGESTYFGSPASGVWATANSVVYQPVVVPVACVVRRAWWANGATTSGQNISAAIYTSTSTGVPGSKLVETAATAQGTASQVQFADVTDTALGRGLYWIALAVASVSSTTLFRVTMTNASAAMVKFGEASITVGALPATATPANHGTQGQWLFGFATTASP